MDAPFNLEDSIWKSIMLNDTDKVLENFKKSTAIYFRGERYEGDAFAKELCSRKMRTYSIDLFEVLISEDINERETLTQVIYRAKIIRDKESDTEIYSIASTWKRSETENELIAAMIQDYVS